MFGSDFEVKELQLRAEYANADMETINAWVKSLPKLRRHCNALTSRYVRAYDTLLVINQFLIDMHHKLRIPGKWDYSQRREIRERVRDIKGRGKPFVLEFAVSKDDTDFLLTYDTILKMLVKYDGTEEMRICLCSEIENLQAMIKDKFGLNMAEPLDIAIFYMRHSYDEVKDMTPRARVERIEELSDKEFYEPIAKKMEEVGGYSKQRIVNIVKRYIGLHVKDAPEKKPEQETRQIEERGKEE
ncbi:MAG: hypothetical protein MR016_09405 [Agathobacter sp.]|nr:hypothetical protein [Agathobacter sp.]